MGASSPPPPTLLIFFALASIEDKLGGGFLAYQYGFGSAFAIMTLLGVLQLVLLPRRSKTHIALFAVLIFMVSSTCYLINTQLKLTFPKHEPCGCSWILTTSASFCREVRFLSTSHGSISPNLTVLNEILYGLTMWGVMASYLLVVSLWFGGFCARARARVALFTDSTFRRIETYIKTTTEFAQRNSKLARLRVVIVIFIALLFAINIVQDGLRSVFGRIGTRSTLLAVYTGVIGLIALITSIIYLIFGRRLYVRLVKFRTSGIGNEYIRKVRSSLSPFLQNPLLKRAFR